MAVNWKSTVSVPLWAWFIYWGLALLFSQNIFAAIIAGILLVVPFFEKRYKNV